MSDRHATDLIADAVTVLNAVLVMGNLWVESIAFYEIAQRWLFDHTQPVIFQASATFNSKENTVALEGFPERLELIMQLGMAGLVIVELEQFGYDLFIAINGEEIGVSLTDISPNYNWFRHNVMN